MTTEHVEPRLVPFVHGDVDADERAQVERHLASCAACRAAQVDFETVAETLTRLEAPPISWHAYRAELEDKLAGRAKRRPAATTWQLRPMPIAMAAGLVAMLVYVGGAGVPGREVAQGDVTAIEHAALASRLDLISRLDLMQRLDLFEDFDVIHRLDTLPGRGKG